MLRSFTRLRLPLPAAELALIGITLIWGVTFLIVQIAMVRGGPVYFVGVRFLVAGGLLALVFHRSLRGLQGHEVLAGVAIGIALFLGYALQAFGLQSITSSLSAFITALYVPIVPLLQWMVLRRAPRLMSWVGIGLAFTGLMLLAGPEAFHIAPGIGEITTLLGAVAIAAEIILISHFANGVDSRRVTVVQLLTAGLLAMLFALLGAERAPNLTDGVWLTCAVVLGVASAVIQLTMNWAQKVVSPTRATLIYAAEPVWAGLVGRLAGDRLPFLALAGGVLIVCGVIASELKLKRGSAAPG